MFDCSERLHQNDKRMNADVGHNSINIRRKLEECVNVCMWVCVRVCECMHVYVSVCLREREREKGRERRTIMIMNVSHTKFFFDYTERLDFL